LSFYNFGLNVGLTIQDLQNRQVAQILAEPTITTLSGQKGSFLAGGEFPFPVVQGSSGGLTSITIQFRPYGVKLDFTPVVNADRSVQLKVAPEVSALDYTNAVTISGYTVPAISTRRAETQVELRDGQSFAISGLLDRRTTDIFNKMPGIGDVPVLGQLFRSKNVNHSTVELMVVVTPSIVDPLHDTTPLATPTLPVPTLDPAQFDKSQTKKSGKPAGGAQ
jgi:pilus assembly protein CpaC